MVRKLSGEKVFQKNDIHFTVSNMKEIRADPPTSAGGSAIYSTHNLLLSSLNILNFRSNPQLIVATVIFPPDTEARCVLRINRTVNSTT